MNNLKKDSLFSFTIPKRSSQINKITSLEDNKEKLLYVNENIKLIKIKTIKDYDIYLAFEEWMNKLKNIRTLDFISSAMFVIYSHTENKALCVEISDIFMIERLSKTSFQITFHQKEYSFYRWPQMLILNSLCSPVGIVSASDQFKMGPIDPPIGMTSTDHDILILQKVDDFCKIINLSFSPGVVADFSVNELLNYLDNKNLYVKQKNCEPLFKGIYKWKPFKYFFDHIPNELVE